MLRNSVISFKNKDKITINQIKSNFSICFVHRSGTKYSFGEMDEIGLISPGPPGFFPKMVLNHSQWNLAYMELYLFSVSCRKRKMCFFFILNGLWRIPQNWTGHLLQKPNFSQISNKIKYVVLYIS